MHMTDDSRQDILIALASAPFVNRATEKNLSTLLHYMEEAAQQGVDLVCFGEAFLQGFDCLDWDFATDKNMAVTRDSGEIRRIREASRRLGVDVMFGFIEREGETLDSSCMLVEAGEMTQCYRRMSQGWKESDRTDHHYREGAAAELFHYRGWRCVMTLCGDMWDTTQDAFRLGEDILFWPLYCDYTRDEWLNGELADYARQCRDHASLTLMINSLCQGGSEGGCAVYRQGQVVQLLEPGREGLLLVRPLQLMKG